MVKIAESRFEGYEGVESAVDAALVDAWLWARREVRAGEEGVELARLQLAREETRLAGARRRCDELSDELRLRSLDAVAERVDAERVERERARRSG